MRRICINTGPYYLTIGKTYEVEPYRGKYVKLYDDKGNPITCYDERFEQPDPTKQAINLLTKAGYVVTPPPPKTNGWITIYRGRQSPEGIVALSSHEIARNGGLTNSYDVIAVVPWTEGDGL